MEISIIVPAYNVSQFIDRVVKSLLNQNFHLPYEVIIVNDGSKDDTKEKLDIWQSMYPEIIKVFHQENAGLSAARNYGLDKACGNYIAFVDSDDYVSPDYLKVLYDSITQNGSQIAMCAINRCFGSDGSGKLFDSGFTRDFVTNDIDNVLLKSSFSAWAKLFDARLLNGQKFPLGMTYEDFAFIPQIMNKATCISYTHKILYHYYVNMNGIIMSKKNTTDRNIIKAQHILESSSLRSKPYILENFYIRRVLESMCHSLILHNEDMNLVNSLVDEAYLKYPDIRINPHILQSSLYKKVYFYLLLRKRNRMVSVWVKGYNRSKEVVKKILKLWQKFQ